MTPETLPPANRGQDGQRGLIAIRAGLLCEDDAAQAQLQNGNTLQVVLCCQYLLFHGQTCRERAIVLDLLRHLKAQSLTDGEAERRKLRGARN